MAKAKKSTVSKEEAKENLEAQKVEEGQIYVVCPGKSICSKGKTFVEGDEMKHTDFVNGVKDMEYHVNVHGTLKLNA